MKTKDNDVFTGWNNFPEMKPTYDFQAIVEFDDGGKWIGTWENGKWDFAEPLFRDFGRTVVRWMAFP